MTEVIKMHRPSFSSPTSPSSAAATFEIHPLERKWTLWYDAPMRNKAGGGAWGENLHEVYTVQSVEEFWSVFSNICGPASLPIAANYYFFKTGIRPVWEDEVNKNGGKWVAKVARNHRGDRLNRAWLTVILALVGECFPHEDEICGAVVNIRKPDDRICIWTKTANDEAALRAIGGQLRTLVKDAGITDAQFSFQPFFGGDGSGVASGCSIELTESD